MKSGKQSTKETLKVQQDGLYLRCMYVLERYPLSLFGCPTFRWLDVGDSCSLFVICSTRRLDHMIIRCVFEDPPVPIRYVVDIAEMVDVRFEVHVSPLDIH